MLTPAEAETIIRDSLALLPVESCALEEAHNRVLREPIVADRDSPPFDRATMDGFAVQSAAMQSAPNQPWRIAGFQPAGSPPQTLPEGEAVAIEIATGAVFPKGADAVVPYEDTVREGESFSLKAGAEFKAGQNRHREGSDYRAGTLLVPAGRRLSAREIAVAASSGYAKLSVTISPRIAVVATGDELVEVGTAKPLPHQIRRSNDLALAANLRSAGYPSVTRYHLKDNREDLLARLPTILAENEVFLFTGGISKGKLDLLPAVLDELGVRKIFQGVAQRPGKPLWFGRAPRGQPVFALPGNPVSTYLCFQRYILGALAAMSGIDASRTLEEVELGAPLKPLPTLAFLVPVHLERGPQGSNQAVPHLFNTSGDFASLLKTDGFIELPPGTTPLVTGTRIPFSPWL